MNIDEQVIRLFIATDERDWDTAKKCFADIVELDYSSMSGQPAADMTADDIISAWKQLLPGFESTHHQIGNMMSTTSGDSASLFCYGTAAHYLEHKNGNVWTVVGSYDFDLKLMNNEWRITKMKFNFKYQDGNKELVNLAADALK